METLNKITENEVQEMIESDKKKIQQILNEGGKITNITIYEKEKITTIKKIEPVNGKTTSSKIIQSRNDSTISCL